MVYSAKTGKVCRFDIDVKDIKEYRENLATRGKLYVTIPRWCGSGLVSLLGPRLSEWDLETVILVRETKGHKCLSKSIPLDSNQDPLSLHNQLAAMSRGVRHDGSYHV